MYGKGGHGPLFFGTPESPIWGGERTLMILPGTGRGTMRSMVEGQVRSSAAYDLLCPSTALRVVPLPRWGRIGYFRSKPAFRR